MKITSIDTMEYTYPMAIALGNGRKWNRERSCVLIKVVTDEGITGYGEADASGGPPSVTSCIVKNEIAPRIIGMDPFCVEAIWQNVYSNGMVHGRRGAVIPALSGVDVAIWDIIGKALGQPIYKLLGGARDKVLAYHSGGFYKENAEDTYAAEEASVGYSDGFRAFKIKIGRFDLQRDVERVRLTRQAIGTDSLLMVDANSSYTAKQAIAMAQMLEPFNIFFFEEPISADDPKGSAVVANSTSIAVAGYETEHTRYGFRDLIDMRAIDIAQCDVIRSGGYTECRKIAAYASAHNLPCTSHVFSSGISLLANLHFVTAIDNGFLFEYETNVNPLRTEMFSDFRLSLDEDGYVSVPKGPGLGATIDFEAIEPYRIR